MVSTCFKCLQAQWAMIKMIIFWGGNWSANFEHRCICHCHGGANDECHDLRNDGSTEDWGSPWSSTLYTLSIDINSYFSILFLCPYLFLTFSSCFPSVFPYVFMSFGISPTRWGYLRIKRSPKLPLFCPFQAWHGMTFFWKTGCIDGCPHLSQFIVDVPGVVHSLGQPQQVHAGTERRTVEICDFFLWSPLEACCRCLLHHLRFKAWCV